MKSSFISEELVTYTQGGTGQIQGLFFFVFLVPLKYKGNVLTI